MRCCLLASYLLCSSGQLKSGYSGLFMACRQGLIPLRPGAQNVVARPDFVIEQITNTTGPMTDFPRSLIEFQQRFGDEAACA
jgi:hypothetical protein